MKTCTASVLSYRLPALAALSCAAFGTAPLHASFIMVNWGGQYVDNNQSFNGTLPSYTVQNNQNLDGTGTGDDSRFGIAYNSSIPVPLSPQSGYSGTSGTFYGGFVVNTFGNANADTQAVQPNAQGVHNNGSTDHLKFQTQHSGNDHHSFALLMHWNKADFLNGGDGGAVTLNNLSTFSLDIRNNSNINENTHLHFVVRNGTQFYTSEAFYGGTGASLLEAGYLGAIPDGGTATLNPVVSGLGWKAYNPDGLDLQWQHGSWTSPTFDNITGVGFFFDTLAFSQNNNNLELEGFRFSAIPEPSSALLALGGLGAVLLHRRRG